MKKILFASLLLFGINGCYYDNLKEIHPSASTVRCDTSSSIAYSKHMQPIFDMSCGTNNTSCHQSTSSLGNYGLANYHDALKDVSNGVLVDRITTSDNSKLMPKNGSQLPECIINEIKTWVNNGAPQF
jgi:hypothetical protein